MDRLLTYIEQRSFKYGHITGTQALSSNYYTIGNITIRISDHITYGKNSGSKSDYNFIIQEDGTYILAKIEKDGKMYLKVVQYQEARMFIRRLHEFAIESDNMCEFYHPKGWNVDVDCCGVDKMSFDELLDSYKHIYQSGDTINGIKLMNIIDIISIVLTGTQHKGTLEEKRALANQAYESDSVTSTQYKTIIEKINRMAEKCTQ